MEISGRVTAIKAAGRCLILGVEIEEAGACCEQIIGELDIEDDIDIVITIRKRCGEVADDNASR